MPDCTTRFRVDAGAAIRQAAPAAIAHPASGANVAACAAVAPVSLDGHALIAANPLIGSTSASACSTQQAFRAGGWLVDDAVAVVVDPIACFGVAGKTRAAAVIAVVAATHRRRMAVAVPVEHGEAARCADRVAGHAALASVAAPLSIHCCEVAQAG